MAKYSDNSKGKDSNKKESAGERKAASNYRQEKNDDPNKGKYKPVPKGSKAVAKGKNGKSDEIVDKKPKKPVDDNKKNEGSKNPYGDKRVDKNPKSEIPNRKKKSDPKSDGYKPNRNPTVEEHPAQRGNPHSHNMPKDLKYRGDNKKPKKDKK